MKRWNANRNQRVYVPHRDRHIWEAAAELAAANKASRRAPDSLSALVIVALEEYLRRCRK